MKDRLLLSVIRISVALFIINCGGCDNFNPLSYDCSVFPDQATSAYILPYEVGNSFTANPHAANTQPDTQDAVARAQYYAIDIPMPIGTPLVASREGTVVRVEEQFVDGDNQGGHENFLIIEHNDGAFSRYFHLTSEGALVSVGDSVLQLDIIAISGHTGNSSEPHLHFDVVDKNCDPDGDNNNNNELRACQTFPVTFRNTRTLDCGLEFGESYTALPF